MDYVYICRQGNNEELRYSIRSVVKNLPEGRIWLIGGKPDWYHGDHIPVKDSAGKFESIVNCWKIISKNNNISDDFILMNDDFFVLNSIDFMPTYHGGRLDNKIEKYTKVNGSSKYVRILSETRNKLRRLGIDSPLDYDIHLPMPINKNNINEDVLKSLAPRTIYGNLNKIGGTEIQDVKVYKPGKMSSLSYGYDESINFISCEDESFEILFNILLKNKFPNKTNYEL